MTASTATLADFLLARVIDDIVLARSIQAQAVTDGFTVDDPRRPELTLAARVLADCAARRAIVEQAARWDALCAPDDWPEGDMSGAPLSDAGRWILRHLAAPYASVDGYDEAWALP